jgi:hypothetical protein
MGLGAMLRRSEFYPITSARQFADYWQGIFLGAVFLATRDCRHAKFGVFCILAGARLL